MAFVTTTVVEAPKLVHPEVLSFRLNKGTVVGNVLIVVLAVDAPEKFLVSLMTARPSSIAKLRFHLLFSQKFNLFVVELKAHKPGTGVGTETLSVGLNNATRGNRNPFWASFTSRIALGSTAVDVLDLEAINTCE